MIISYFKIAFRNLWKNKTFTIINLAGLALGITCALGIFMIVAHEFSYDTFHPNHKKIYRVVSEFRYPSGIELQSGVPLALPESFRLDFPQVSEVGGIFGGYNNQIDITGDGTTGEKRFKIETGVFYTSPSFFKIFKFKWISGDPSVVLVQPNQAAITESLAVKYFGSWQNALGKMIRKDNNELLQIAGIIDNPPVNTDFPLQVVISYTTLLHSDYGRKLSQDWGTVSSRSQCYILCNTAQDAPSMKSALTGFRNKHLGKENTTDYYSLQPLGDLHFNADYGNFNLYTISKSTLWSLSMIGIFLLALACINFINLATAQAVKRSREVGIRKVLGSQRWQLAVQFMSETLLLVISAGILSVLLLALLEPLTDKIINEPVSLNPLHSYQGCWYMAIVLAAVSLLAGLYPSFIVSGFRPIQALKNKMDTKTVSGISLRRVLVVVQFVIAQGLIFVTLIIVSQLKFFQHAPMGFASGHVINLALPKDSVSRAQYETFRRQLLQVPGVEQVSLSYSPPSSTGSHVTSFRFNQTIKDEPFELLLNAADTGFFNTYQLRFIAGHSFQSTDTAREIVINETLAAKLGIVKAADALGKYIVLDKTLLPVVGVVKDFHQHSLHTAIEPMALVADKSSYRIASIKFDAAAEERVLKASEAIYHQAFPNYLADHQFLDETIASFYKQEKKLSRLAVLFSAAGIFISCIGLYGLILFMTLQRVKEVGIRKILGASVVNIVLLFCREFVWLILIAFVMAVSGGAYFMEQWLHGFAYHITLSWWMFGLVGVSALALALLTVSFQTIKSAIANPVKSLRSE